MKSPATFRPPLGAIIWTVFFLGLAYSDWRFVLISADGDAAWHWRSGNWMLEHREFIRTDPFSHTRPGAPTLSKDWLAELLFAAAGNLFGWQGLVLVAAAVVATTVWRLYRLALREGADALTATGVTVLAAWTMSHHWLARPHLFTHLLTVLFLGILRDGRRWWWLPVLMAFWVNLHGAFLTGFVLLGCYWLAAWRDRPRQVALTGVGLACVAATLVNPYGWQLHAHILDFLQTPAVANFSNEWRSPNFHSGGMTGLLVLLLALALVLMLARPKLGGVDVWLLAVWGYFALRTVRNVAVFGIVTAPILARYTPHWTRLASLAAGFNMPRRARWWLPVAAIGLALAVRPATEVVADQFPVKAVAFVKANPAVVTGQMFNAYGWGGYLMWALPEQPVFIDGRNDFYGVAVLAEFQAVDKVQAGWETVLARYQVGWTILPARHPLNAVLALHPDWQELYRDKVAVIFVHRPLPAKQK